MEKKHGNEKEKKKIFEEKEEEEMEEYNEKTRLKKTRCKEEGAENMNMFEKEEAKREDE